MIQGRGPGSIPLPHGMGPRASLPPSIGSGLSRFWSPLKVRFTRRPISRILRILEVGVRMRIGVLEIIENQLKNKSKPTPTPQRGEGGRPTSIENSLQKH